MIRKQEENLIFSENNYYFLSQVNYKFLIKLFSVFLFTKFTSSIQLKALWLLKIQFFILTSSWFFLIGSFKNTSKPAKDINFFFKALIRSFSFIIGPRATLIIAALFKGFYKLHVHYILFTKKTTQLTKITFFTGLINLGLSYVLILNFGLIGAAYSLVIINFLQYVLSFNIGNKLVPMPWFKFHKIWVCSLFLLFCFLFLPFLVQ